MVPIIINAYTAYIRRLGSNRKVCQTPRMTIPSIPAFTDSSGIEGNFRSIYLWLACSAGALGGLLFGYDWVVIGGAKPFYEEYFHLTTEAMKSWAMSCALVGCLGGAVLSGVLSDRFGRKRLLLLSAFIFALSSLGTAMAGSPEMFILNRIMGGIAIGLASNLSPMYIAEMAPAAVRGRLVAVNQLTIVIGILLAQCVNWLIAEFFLPGQGQVSWRWMFGVTVVPSLFFLGFMFLVPESPRWLAKNGKEEQAQNVLARIGGPAYAVQALADIRQSLVHEIQKVDYRELLQPRLRRVLGLGIFLAVFQQWCGINVFFNYAHDIFGAAGYSVSENMWNIVVTGTVNLLFTLVAMATVDRQGRRSLMLLGSLGLGLVYILLGACFFWAIKGWILILVITAMGSYALSMAPVTWVVLAEIFPNRIRGAALAVCVFALWAGCFTLTLTFPFLYEGFGPARTFWIFAAICVVGHIFIRLFLPETKGKTLEQIEKELVK